MTDTHNSIFGKTVMLIVNQDDEREAFTQALEDMQLQVTDADSGLSALASLEDEPVDLLIMDIHPTDMHGWQLLAKLQEIEQLRRLPIIIITDQPTAAPSIKPVACLLRPVSIARLRQYVVDVLNSAVN